MTFEDLDLTDDVLDALYDMHFDQCTPIQEQAIPLVLEGRDLIAVAQTGTGKTAAYLLPVISRLQDDNAPRDAINCIVMAPTRELAQQIDQQMEGFSYYMDISSVAIYGGTDGPTFARQQRGLKMGADVVIATPGRLLAHLQMGYVDLSRVQYFILDEADRMLDMGFYDDIMQIVRQLPAERRTLMFSATMPPKIKKLASEILNDPAEVKIAVSRPAEGIDQSAYICHEAQKTPILRHLLKTSCSKRVIVFASSKLKVKELFRELKRAGINVAQIHSDLEQRERDDVMLGFRAARIDVLVATDIVARGIDIDDIAMVVNYDVPFEAEDYVHRIGRTARAGAEGRAITFVSSREQTKFHQIESFLEKDVPKNEIPAELGQGPAYNPERSRRSSSGRKPAKGGQRKASGQKSPKPKASGDKPRSKKPQNAKPQGEKPQQHAENTKSGKPKNKRRFYHRPKNSGNSSNGSGQPAGKGA